MTTRNIPSNKFKIISLWTVQGLLAASLLWAASMKWFQTAEALAHLWPWTAEHHLLVKLTGLTDLLAGIGIILPSLLRWSNRLTILAACGIIALMIAATVFHVSRGEASEIGFNVIMALLASYVIWGKWKS